jgi:hypothetical protein
MSNFLHTFYRHISPKCYWKCIPYIRFDKLITALRTAVDNNSTLDKEATSYNDMFDALRLALKFYHFGESIS